MAVALIRMRRYLALATIIAGFAACSSSDITNPDQIVFPSSNVSYAHDVAPYLQLSCNAAGCHDAATAAGGVDLTSWINVRNPHVTQPGDTTSPLVLVM